MHYYGVLEVSLYKREAQSEMKHFLTMFSISECFPPFSNACPFITKKYLFECRLKDWTLNPVNFLVYFPSPRTFKLNTRRKFRISAKTLTCHAAMNKFNTYWICTKETRYVIFNTLHSHLQNVISDMSRSMPTFVSSVVLSDWSECGWSGSCSPLFCSEAGSCSDSVTLAYMYTLTDRFADSKTELL